MLKLTDLQELTELIYSKNRYQLSVWLNNMQINIFNTYKILDNDRCIIFSDPDPQDDIVYVITAGTDDSQDWKENLWAATCKRLFYAKKGVAYPAEDIMCKLTDFCETNSIDIYNCDIILDGHSRGADITEAATAFINKRLGEKRVYGWAHGLTGAGGVRFFKRCKCDNFTSFIIRGDFASWINPINKCIGKTIYLPKQLKGFKWFLGLFKGRMNHRSYSCIKDIYPYNQMNARGEY